MLVGVGFEGDLVRAGTVDDQIDQVIGHDPDGWHDLPESVDDLPPALPVNLPNPERRRDYATRNRIEQSWREVRAEMGDTLTSCAPADLRRVRATTSAASSSASNATCSS